MRGRLRPIVSQGLPGGKDPTGAGLVRQARQLRHRLKSKPSEMHRQLARLSSRHATTQSAPSARITTAVAASARPDQRADVAAATAAFTTEVRKHLGLPGTPAEKPTKNGFLLRYSQRLELLRLGEHMGLSRFQANLVIAAVQHESRTSSAALPASPAISTTTLFLATQAVLIATLLAIFLIAGR